MFQLRQYCLYLVLLGSLFSCELLKLKKNEGLVENEVKKEKKKPVWLAKEYDYKPSRTLTSDLLHTKLEISPDWNKRELSGSAVLSFTPYFYPQKSLVLDAKSFDIKHIRLTNGQDLAYRYDSLQLFITLDKEYTRKDTFHVEIEYMAKPYELYLQGAKNKTYTKEHGVYFINHTAEGKKPRQLWTQGEPEFSSCWFPTIDSPNEKTTQEIYITVEEKYKTLSNGVLIYSRDNGDGSRTDYWKQSIPHAPYLFMMAIGDYAVVEGEWKGIPLYYYVEPPYASLAKDIYAKTPKMLDFYSQLFGVVYPWEKYAQVTVRDFMWGGMENTTATIYLERIQLDKREMLDKSYERLLVHELAHHWFGDYLTAESWANLPLNESFATYSEYLWFEGTYGKDRGDEHLYEELQGYLRESKRKQERIIRYRHSTNLAEMFDAHTYNKGGVVLHQLRQAIGDDAFFTALKLYLQRYALKSVEIHQLRLVFEEVTGQDLHWFFEQWFHSPGHPKLVVEHHFSDSLGLVLNIEQRQDTQYTPVYTIPTRLAYWDQGGRQEVAIRIDKKYQKFTIKMDEAPKALHVGGNHLLLAELSHSKSPDELLYQCLHAKSYLEMSSAYKNIAILDSAQIATHDSEITEVLRKALRHPNSALRLLGLDVSSKLDSSLSHEFSHEWEQLALNDKKAVVRRKAYHRLIQLKEHKLSNRFLTTGLKDSSYQVVALCLNELLKKEGDAYAQAYQTETHFPVAKVLAEYYIRDSIAGQLPWFLERLSSHDWVYSYHFMSLLRKYLLIHWDKIQEVQKDEALNMVEKMALTHQLPHIKRVAYDLLFALKEKKGVVSRLKRIESLEHHVDMIAHHRNKNKKQ